jgi:hypothetical protein
MQGLLERLLRRIDRSRFRRNVEEALALDRRGKVRQDGQLIKDSRNWLVIVWQARDIYHCR